MSRYVKGLAVGAVLALTASACTTSDGGETPQGREGGSITAYLTEPDALDPAIGTTVTSSEVQNVLFDTLIHYNTETAEPEFTGAAESVDISPDATTLTYRLREGATFHDGSDVTAEDFVRGITRVALQETASELAYHLDGIQGFAEAQAGDTDELAGVRVGDDPLELVIELEEPNAEFFIRTGHKPFSPVPELATEDPDAYNEQPIGNGPYMMDGPWQHNESIRVVKFPDYNGPTPGFLDEINFDIILQIETGYLEFQGGNLDVATVPPEQFGDAEATYGDAFVEQQTTGLTYLGFDAAEAPTDNALFRQALSLSIDREAIIDAVFAGARVPGTSIIPPGNVGYREGACEFCTHDPDLARQKLEESGVDVNRITVTFNSGAGHEEWVGAAAAQIEEALGITVRIDPGSEDFGDYLGTIGADPPEMYRLGWGQDYPTPDNWLFPLFHSQSGDNYGNYDNPEFDALIVEAQRTLDDAARLQLQNDAEVILLQDMPITPIFYEVESRVYDAEKIANFVLDVQQGNPDYRLMSLA